MHIDDTGPHVLSNPSIEVNYQDLADRIQMSGNMPQLLDTAKKAYDTVMNRWQPAAVYRWCGFQYPASGTTGRIIRTPGGGLDIDFGCSVKFLAPATHVLVAVYTAGSEIERYSMEASRNGDVLVAYFIDLIGLIVLEKTGNIIKRIARHKAVEMGRGVSPFLSPGSVHGWKLEEQTKLCTLLPLDQINVSIRNDAVLTPFKTISCLIGLGAGYDVVDVGETCRVCSKRDECQMKHRFPGH